MVKVLNVTFSDSEWVCLLERKGVKTWRDFLLGDFDDESKPDSNPEPDSVGGVV